MANSGSENKTYDDTLSFILFEAILDIFHLSENKNNFLNLTFHLLSHLCMANDLR